MGCSILDSSCSLLSLAIHPASGSLDTSFGAGNGFVEYNSPGGGANGQDVGQGVAIDASGRIYVSGVTTNSVPDSDVFVCRLFDDGSLDTSFATAAVLPGCAILNTGVSDSTNGGIHVLADGRVLVTGTANGSMIAGMFRSDGGLDSSFGGTGIVTLTNGTSTEGESVHVDSTGKIYIVGRSNCPSPGCDWTVWKLNADGSLDTSFNATGFLTNTGGYATSFDLHLDSSNRVVTTGMLGATATMEVRRYDSNGNPDTSFNGSGVYTFPLGGFLSTAGASLAFDPFSNIVVTGTAQVTNPNDSDAIVWRLGPDGGLDGSFAGGFVTANNAGGSQDVPANWRDENVSVAVDLFGRVIALGVSCNNSGFDVCPGGSLKGYSLIVYRYNFNGTPDSSFNNGSYFKALTPNVFYQNTYALKMALTLDSRGRIVVAGGYDPDTAAGGDAGVIRVFRLWP